MSCGDSNDAEKNEKKLKFNVGKISTLVLRCVLTNLALRRGSLPYDE